MAYVNQSRDVYRFGSGYNDGKRKDQDRYERKNQDRSKLSMDQVRDGLSRNQTKNGLSRNQEDELSTNQDGV